MVCLHVNSTGESRSVGCVSAHLAVTRLSADDFGGHVLNGATERVGPFPLDQGNKAIQKER